MSSMRHVSSAKRWLARHRLIRIVAVILIVALFCVGLTACFGPPSEGGKIDCFVAIVTGAVAVGLAASMSRQPFGVVTAIGFTADVLGFLEAWKSCLWEANERGFGCHGFKGTWKDKVVYVDWCDNVIYPW